MFNAIAVSKILPQLWCLHFKIVIAERQSVCSLIMITNITNLMKAPENFFKEARKDIDEFIQNNLLLLKLQGNRKISKAGYRCCGGLLVICFFYTFLLSILGVIISQTAWRYLLGFGIIAAFYILLLTLMIVSVETG